MTRTRRLLPVALPALLLGACASTVPVEPPYDPLPALFPVQVQAPQRVAGFELQGDQADPDPQVGRTLVYADPAMPGVQVEVQVRFGGAYVDGAEALADQWPQVVGQIDAAVAAADLQVESAASDRRRQIRASDGGPQRDGRSLRLRVRAADGQAQMAAHDLYFVDPYLVSLSSRFAAADQTTGTRLDDFAAAFVAALKPAPEVLCDPRVQVLKVRTGLSNVSSNGRVIFVSTQTDNVDTATVNELKRAAAQQRERAGCPPGPQDFSAVEAQMRRHARVR